MNHTTLILGAFFLLMNLTAFGVLWFDKLRSRLDHERRISEGMLFFLAVVFGSIGVLTGMFVFRHKTRKWYFLVGIPLLVLENAAFLYVALLVLAGR